jgi:hypothetical protein
MSNALSSTSSVASRFVGEMALLIIAAVAIGYIIAKFWPKSANPQLFATLIPFTGLAVAAYLGSGAAAAALVGFAIVAIGAFMTGIG